MPSGVGTYNTNPALNNLINGIDIGEGSDAAGYNDALRQIMADIATWISTPGLLASIGGLSATYSHLILSLKTGNFHPVDSESGFAYNLAGTVATITLDPEATTPVTNGFAATIRNSQVGSVAVARGAGVTLEVNGGTVSANATIAPGAVATLIKWGVDFWTITGAGVS
jgi:hypothetical protein